jgi:hypothetical protein
MSYDFDTPIVDARQDVQLVSAVQTAGSTVVTLYRRFATDDAADVDLLPGALTQLAFGWSTTDPNYEQSWANRLTTVIDLWSLADSTPVPTDLVGTPSATTVIEVSSPVPTVQPDVVGRDRTATLSAALSLSWLAPHPSDLSINITFTYASTNGWFSFGVRSGAGMVGTDAWTVQTYTAGTITVTDGLIHAYNSPTPDAQQDIQVLSAVQAAGNTVITLSRLLSTGDAADFDIQRGRSTPVVAAWGSNPTLGYHGSNRLVGTLDFFAVAAGAGGLAGDDDVDLAGDPELIRSYSFHAIIMGGIWGLVVPLGIFARRFYAHKSWAVLFHKWGSTTALTLTLPAAGQAMLQGGAAATSVRVNIHRVLGKLVTGGMVLQAALGLLSLHFLHSKTQPPRWWRKAAKFHVILGYAELLGASANMILGLRLMLGYAYMFASVSLVFILILTAIALQRLLAKLRWAGQGGKQNALIPASISRALIPMSMSELRQGILAGRKLLVWNGMVLDVGHFIEIHPGGTYLLEANLGEDVTSWFRGHESNDASVPSHVHSKVAKDLALSMVVGALRSGAEEHGKRGGESSWGDVAIQGHEGEVDRSSKLWRLENKVNVIDDATRLPVVRLEFSAAHAHSCRASLWSVTSFGRYVMVHVSLDNLNTYLDEHEEERRAALFAQRKKSRLGRFVTSFQTAPAVPSTQSSGIFTPPHYHPPISDTGSQEYDPIAQAGGSQISPFGSKIYSNGLSGSASSSRQLSPRVPKAHRGSMSPKSEHTSVDSTDSAAKPSVGTPNGSSRSLLQLLGKNNSSGRRLGSSRKIRGVISDSVPITSRSLRKLSGKGATHALDDSVPQVQRPYTMVRHDGEDGLVLYVRRYPVGTVSRYLADLPVGGTCTISGPCGLGLRIDPASRGGILVTVVQGSCIASIFDLIQHIWSRYLERMENSFHDVERNLAKELKASFPGWTRKPRGPQNGQLPRQASQSRTRGILTKPPMSLASSASSRRFGVDSTAGSSYYSMRQLGGDSNPGSGMYAPPRGRHAAHPKEGGRSASGSLLGLSKSSSVSPIQNQGSLRMAAVPIDQHLQMQAEVVRPMSLISDSHLRPF